MKESIVNIGAVLTKTEQKQVNGGGATIKKYDPHCERIVNEGICWGYMIEAQYNPYQGSGYYEFPCDC